MTPNAATQLAILADALTEIVDLAIGGPKLVAPPVEPLARAGDLAAEALAVAATHGPVAAGHGCRRDGAGRRYPRSAAGAMTAL
jgi:hypothetical protein